MFLFCFTKQNRHCLNALCHCCGRKAWAASAQSFTLWQQATIEITSSLLSPPLASTPTFNCFLASQALLEASHQDHSYGITLLLLVRTTYIWPDGCYSSRTCCSWWIAHSTQGQLRCCNTTFSLSCLWAESLTYLASLTYRLTKVLFQVNCIKKQAEVFPHSPVATWWA